MTIRKLALNCDTPTPFADYVFEQNNPADLRQTSWRDDHLFLKRLHRSWQQQYAEYLGEEPAASLLGQLIADGSLYAHDPALTLQAMIDEQRVGIASMRVLSKERGLALITMLEVQEQFQGHGIGRQLVNALASASVHLMAHVSIHRPQVKTFYQRLGFKCLERAIVDHYGHALEFDVVAR